MALTGKLNADFEPFFAAVQKAEVSLKSFESGAGKVDASLNKMTNAFSGQKVIQDATLMAEAVQRIGGTSMLTERELARVGATAAEAVAKMKALGIEVPPGLQKIASEAKAADTAHSGMLGTVKQLALGFAAMFTVRAGFDFVKGVLADASALADLSQQTHIGVEDLQRLAGAMSEFGVDTDTLGKGLFSLSRRIAGSDGSDSVAGALHAMGLSLRDVKGQQGQELFLTMEHALAKLQGSLRDTTASDLFGSKLGMAMAGASEGIDGAVAAAQHMQVQSADTVAQLDKFGESIDRATKNLSGLAANMLGPLAEGFNVFFSASDKGATKLQILSATTHDYLDVLFRTGTGTEHLATLLDHLNQKTDANTGATKTQKNAHEEITPAMVARAKAIDDLTKADAAAAKAALAHAEAIKVLQTHLFGGDVTAKAADYAAALGGVENASKLTAAAQKELHDVMATAYEVLVRAGQGATSAAAEYLRLRDATADLAGAGKALSAMPDPFAESSAKRSKAFRDTQMAILNENTILSDNALYWMHGGEIADAAMATTVAAIETVAPAAQSGASQVQQSFGSAFGAVAQGAMSTANMIAQLLSDSAINERRGGIAATYGFLQGQNAQRLQNGLPSLPSFATGGSGDFGSGTQVMLHGRERIVPLDGPNAGGGTVIVNVNAGGAFFDTPESRARLGEVVGAAVLAKMKGIGARV